jgi:hypothetical protein
MTPSTVPKPEPSPVRQVVYANLVFYAFLALVSFIGFVACGRVWDDVFYDALKFLFLILGGGFTLVSVLELLYEKTYGSHGGERP